MITPLSVDILSDQLIEVEMHLEELPKYLNLPALAIRFAHLFIRLGFDISGKAKFYSQINYSWAP